MAKMIYCKTCGAQIAKNAKTCPQCGAKNKRHGFLKILLAVVILGGIGSAVSGGQSGKNQPTDRTVPVTTSAKQETKAAEKMTAEVAESAAEKMTEEVAESAAEKMTEEVAESAAEKITQEVIESTAEKTAEAVAASAKTETEAAAATEATETLTEAVESATTVPQPETEAVTEDKDGDGVTPELKEFLDQYEKCIDEYCTFMESFDANSTDPMAILKYSSLMQEYLDFAEKAEAYDEKEMTNEDLKYYIDVMARIEKRMLDVTIK